jgi:adenosylhomocysteinase
LSQISEADMLRCPAIDVTEKMPNSKFSSLYGLKDSLIEGIQRATGMDLTHKNVVFSGYGAIVKAVDM